MSTHHRSLKTNVDFYGQVPQSQRFGSPSSSGATTAHQTSRVGGSPLNIGYTGQSGSMHASSESQPYNRSSLSQQNKPVISETRPRSNNKSAPEATERRPTKRCIPTFDARLSRLENMLEGVLPNASKIASPQSNYDGWAKNKTRQLELPEDPLLDGAVEDAMLAGQPIHAQYPSEPPSRHTGNISTARLFLESNQKFR